MEINDERIVILKLLEDKEKDKGGISSKRITEETGLPSDRVLKELKYLEKMSQIKWHTILGDSKIIDIKLTKNGQETLEANRNMWTKIKSKITGFNIGLLGVGLKL